MVLCVFHRPKQPKGSLSPSRKKKQFSWYVPINVQYDISEQFLREQHVQNGDNNGGYLFTNGLDFGSAA